MNTLLKLQRIIFFFLCCSSIFPVDDVTDFDQYDEKYLSKGRFKSASGFGVIIAYGFGINGKNREGLPLIKPATIHESTIMIGLGLHLRLAERFEFFFNPVYTYSEQNTFLFIGDGDVFIYGIQAPIGLHYFFGKNHALTAAVLTSFETAAEIKPPVFFSNSRSVFELGNKDLARPGFGGKIGLSHFIELNESYRLRLGVGIEFKRTVLGMITGGLFLNGQISYIL